MSRYDPNRREDCDNDDDHEEVRQLRRISSTLNNIHSDIHQLTEFVTQPGRPTLGAFIAAVHGRRCTMPATIPVPNLLDTEKVQLSVMPRKADGHVDAVAVVVWATSDAAQVGVEPGTEAFDFADPQFSETVTCPGNFNCWATTPNASGAATVTVSAAGYESAEFAITYAPGVARSLNASTGTPVSDTDVPPTP